MSNILIIKHGSLGDIAQVSGAIQDIYDNHINDRIYILTTKPYLELLKKNPFIHEVIVDKRLSKFNLIYLYSLMRNLKKLKLKKVYDLQNSSRTTFYKKILFPSSNYNVWSSSITTLSFGEKKEDFDMKPVLNRFDYQLKTSGLKTNHTLKPDFSWSCTDIEEIKKKYDLENYIVLFPFCSPHLNKKKWPYFNELINLLNNKYKSKYKIVIAPGPSEIKDAKDIDAICVLNKEKSLNLPELSSLIKDSLFVVANDTGPAHIAAHLNKRGITLFGEHISASRQSIETEKFKAIQVSNLMNLTPNKVLEYINLD